MTREGRKGKAQLQQKGGYQESHGVVDSSMDAPPTRPRWEAKVKSP